VPKERLEKIWFCLWGLMDSSIYSCNFPALSSHFFHPLGLSGAEIFQLLGSMHFIWCLNPTFLYTVSWDGLVEQVSPLYLSWRLVVKVSMHFALTSLCDHRSYWMDDPLNGECLRKVLPLKLPSPISCQALITSSRVQYDLPGHKVLDFISAAVLGPEVPEPIQAQENCFR